MALWIKMTKKTDRTRNERKGFFIRYGGNTKIVRRDQAGVFAHLTEIPG
jgi:hypothetical protein